MVSQRPKICLHTYISTSLAGSPSFPFSTLFALNQLQMITVGNNLVLFSLCNSMLPVLNSLSSC